MKNAGIDYSNGMSNVDTKTGIHYGVISQNEVLQAWADSSEPFYVNHCPHCGEVLTQETLDGLSDGKELPCLNCGTSLDESAFDDEQPQSYTLDDGEYIAECGDDGDIFIIKSPYYTYCQYCSPCAPGAGYLINAFKGPKSIMMDMKNDIIHITMYEILAKNAGFPKVYCFSHDFFDDGKAPYPVFSVKTGELINP